MSIQPQKKPKFSVAELNDDLILEIISKLQPRNLFQCKCLNKFFYESISDPSFIKKLYTSSNNNQIHLVENAFRSSFDNPIFSIIDINCTAPHIPKFSRNVHGAISLIDSCNGILLLQTRHLFKGYLVFNPITGGIATVLTDRQYSSPWLYRPTSLIVEDVDITSSRSFKLVEVLRRNDDSDDVRFNVVVPCKDGNYLKTTWDFPVLGFSGFALNSNHKPVYLHGCLYWIEKFGQKVLSFNIETKSARVINGPAIDNVSRARLRAWFGVARGSLSFVRALPTEVVVSTYDYVNDKWQIQHKHVHASCVLKDIPYHGFPVFYDGQRIFFQRHTKYEDIYMFDGSKNRWMMTGMVPGWSIPTCPYIPFYPTLTKVSDVYLQDDVYSGTNIKHLSLVKENLLELQKLFKKL